jgi:hypothetical protein
MATPRNNPAAKRPNPFAGLVLKDVLELLKAAKSPATEVNAAFYAGDHWQGGNAWVGPRPKGNDANAREVLDEIARQFVSTNVIREVVNRHRDGVVSREPSWSYTVARPLKDKEKPTTAEQALIKEAEAAMTTWWDERGIHATIQEVIAQALQTGRCVLRIYLPPAYVDENTGAVEQVQTLAEALDRIWLDVPAPDQALHHRDKKSMQRVGVYGYTEDEQERAELTFVDGTDTVVQIIGDGEGDARIIEEIRMPLGGRLISFEIQLTTLVTEQLRQLQQSLNMVLTMMLHNVMLAGFVERVISNAEMPFDEVDDTANPGKKKRVYRRLDVGMGKTTILNGRPIRNAEKQIIGVSTPNIQWRQPVDVTAFVQSDDAIYRRMLKEVKQLHSLISGESAPSGESRKQALTDFVSSLTTTASAVNALTRWLLETVLAFASYLNNRPGAFDGLRSVVQARLYVGPLSSEDRKAILEMYKDKLISRPTAMSLLEVEDVDAELALLNADEEAAAERQSRTLAAAVVAQRARMASGAASTGLEQPNAIS